MSFEHYFINAIGVLDCKCNNNRRLISASCGSKQTPSLNELVDKDKFSMQYVSNGGPIRIIKSLSFKSCLLNTDITNAFSSYNKEHILHFFDFF